MPGLRKRFGRAEAFVNLTCGLVDVHVLYAVEVLVLVYMLGQRRE